MNKDKQWECVILGISRYPGLLGLTKVRNPKREKALVQRGTSAFFMVCNFTNLRKTTLLCVFLITLFLINLLVITDLHSLLG